MPSIIQPVLRADYPNYNRIDRFRIGMLQSTLERLANRRHIDRDTEDLVKAMRWSLEKLKVSEQIAVVPSSYMDSLEKHRDTLGSFAAPTPIQRQRFGAFDWLVTELAKANQRLED